MNSANVIDRYVTAGISFAIKLELLGFMQARTEGEWRMTAKGSHLSELN